MRKVEKTLQIEQPRQIEHDALCKCVRCTHSSWCSCKDCRVAKASPYKLCLCKECKTVDNGFCCMVNEYNEDVKEIEECGVVAPYFFNVNTKPDREFYLCEDHFDELTNEDSKVCIFSPFSRDGNRNLYRATGYKIEGE